MITFKKFAHVITFKNIALILYMNMHTHKQLRNKLIVNNFNSIYLSALLWIYFLFTTQLLL